MKKIIIIVSSLLFISPLYSMHYADMGILDANLKTTSSTPSSKENQALFALYESTDPNRYGPLNLPTQITDQDHQDAACLVEKIKQNEFEFKAGYAMRHHLVRHDIARAVICKQYHNIFPAIATDASDLPLWKHLNKYREQIKQTHNIDVVSARINPFYDPPLLASSSLEIVKFLIETAQASIPLSRDVSDRTVIHSACRYDRSPAILAYCLEKYPAGIRDIDNLGGYTPLHYLCRCGLDACNLPDVLAKLAILKKAGANFLQQANNAISALDIVEHQINQKQQYDAIFWAAQITALSTLATHIRAAMEEQQTLLNAQRALARAAKIAEATGQNCSLCLQPMHADLHALDCFHVFHEDCVLQMTHAGHTKCPLCRANTLPKDTTQQKD